MAAWRGIAPGASAIGLVAAERMIKQVPLNILSNALKFTPTGGTARVSSGRRSYGDDMTPEEIKLALTPFGQVASAMNRKHAGTGLGLPLAKAMVELRGGGLMLDSAPGQGTSVSLIFPAAMVVSGMVCEPLDPVS